MRNTQTFRLTHITFLLTVIGIFGCVREDELYSLNNPNGININSIFFFDQANSSLIEADGTSKHQVTINIHPESSPENRTVSIETNLGFFENGRRTDTIVVDANGKRTFFLRSNSTGTARVSAKVKSFIIETQVTFIEALPDDLLVSLDKYNIDSTQSIEVTTSLFRGPSRGIVSNPAVVFYSIKANSVNSQSLVFPAFSQSENGKSKIMIENPFLTSGSFSLEAKCLSPNKDTIKRSVNFRIN
jgi:hypothetical protein